MSQLERLQKINYLIQERGCISANNLMHELEISIATLKRDLEYLRSTFNAPIVYDRDMGGYKFSQPNAGKKFELPGIWFTEQEATALVTIHHLLSSLDPSGLIGNHIAPMISKIDTILGNGSSSTNELRKRIKILGIGNRQSKTKYFEVTGKALLNRNRLLIEYYAKSKDETTQREISPQRLIYYRDNWYLDAFCHKNNGLRSFAVDGIVKAEIKNTEAHEVSSAQLDEEFSESYGIFGGKANQVAKLKFTPSRARWVAKETWHPKQQGKFDASGHYILEFEFNKTDELIMDILKYGSDVEVLSPESLRIEIQTEINNMLKKYG